MIAAVLDANLFYRRYIRDTLLFAAKVGAFRPLWTERILDEALNHLVKRGHMSDEQAEGLRLALRTDFEGAWVEASVEDEARVTLPDLDDRHVLAAAIVEGATVIVTENVADFPPAHLIAHGVVALRVDDFLVALEAKSPALLLETLDRQQASYKVKPLTRVELLHELAKIAPKFANKMRDP